MENLKENKIKIEELKKENYKLKENNKKLTDKHVDLCHNNYEQFTKNEETIKKNENKIELNEIKIAILKNNLHYLFKMTFQGIQEKMINYFENKKIGEKTREKIQNEIKEYYENNFNIKIGCYLISDSSCNSSSMEINIYFLNEDGCKDFTFEYNENFKIVLSKYAYNDYELQVSYYNNINDYVELKDVNKKTNELLKNYNKTIEKIEKLRLQQKALYHDFSDYLQGFLHHKLEIKTDLRIY